MKTDRELLELAAKAAEMTSWRWNEYSSCLCHYNEKMSTWYYDDYGDRIEWNPLADDGDAFRLAVTLQIILGKYDEYANAAGIAYSGVDVVVWNHEEKDPYAATRRAIVRAAAEIGASLQINQTKDLT